jgi:hypothetical protein
MISARKKLLTARDVSRATPPDVDFSVREAGE